jgi:hypothetical protein
VTEISLEVPGYPPAKGEALSILGAGHPHAPRVRLLLEVARDISVSEGFNGFRSAPLGLEMILRCPRDRNRGDATNYLGGVGDVLEHKGARRGLEHLGDLAEVSLYDNDRQIEEVLFRWDDQADPSYRIRLWSLGHGF